MQAYLQRLYSRLVRHFSKIRIENISDNPEIAIRIIVFGLARVVRIGIESTQKQASKNEGNNGEVIKRNGSSGHNRCRGQAAG
jgi:hypothetical protein